MDAELKSKLAPRREKLAELKKELEGLKEREAMARRDLDMAKRIWYQKRGETRYVRRCIEHERLMIKSEKMRAAWEKEDN